MDGETEAERLGVLLGHGWRVGEQGSGTHSLNLAHIVRAPRQRLPRGGQDWTEVPVLSLKEPLAPSAQEVTVGADQLGMVPGWRILRTPFLFTQLSHFF